MYHQRSSAMDVKMLKALVFHNRNGCLYTKNLRSVSQKTKATLLDGARIIQKGFAIFFFNDKLQV